MCDLAGIGPIEIVPPSPMGIEQGDVSLAEHGSVAVSPCNSMSVSITLPVAGDPSSWERRALTDRPST